MTAIRHVLFDADGVLQEIPGGWYAAMEPYLGERAREFLHDTWQDEAPTLAGHGDYKPLLAQKLREYGVDANADEVLENVWYRIETDERSLALVRAVRDAGFGVHLGTNQDAHRAQYMKDALAYAELFDRCFYSCDVGAAKPDARFFDRVASAIGADAETILFVDDSERNVTGARDAGLAAIRWELDEGHAALTEQLAAHGIRI